MKKLLSAFGLRTAVPILLFAVAPVACFAQEEGIEGYAGFTAPFREVALAASQPGLLTSLEVQEGDEVKTDAVIARLDHAVLKASLAVAKQQMESVGQLQSAEAELRLREDRWQKLTMLQQRQHASTEEVELAKTERDVAKSRVLAAQEVLAVKKLEHAQINAQLEQRFVRAPFTGLVTLISKDVGEYVPSTDPAIMTVVQLNPLLATFDLAPYLAKNYRKGARVNVVFDGSSGTSETVAGTVSFVSPVNDGQSGTVRLKVEIPNADYKLRSGAKCTLSDTVATARKKGPQVSLAPRKYRSTPSHASRIRISPRK